jgi:hypothetical protein
MNRFALVPLLVGLSLSVAASDPPPAPAPEDLHFVPTFVEGDGDAPLLGPPHPAERGAASGGLGPFPVDLADVAVMLDGEGGAGIRSHIQGDPLPPELADSPDAASPGAPHDLPSPVPGDELEAAGDQSVSWTGLADTGWIPPDTVLAVGPRHVVEATNSGFAVYSKLGDEKQAYTSFSSFFDALKPASWAGFMFDPRVLWSNEHQKFVLLALGRDDANQTAHFFLAISQTTDPLGSWWRWRFDRTSTGGDTNAWLDYSSLGADSWGVYVTGNMFFWTGGFKWSILQTINPAVFSGGSSNGWIFWDLDWPSGSNAFGVQVAHPHTVNGDAETFFANSWSGAGNQVCLWRMSGDRTSSPSLTRTAVGTSATYHSIGEAVDQPGSAVHLDGGDSRVLNAVYHQRRVFASLTTDVNDDGAAAGAFTVKLNTNDNTKEWEHLLWSGNGTYYFYPALSTHGGDGSADPDVGVYYSYTQTTGSTRYASGGVKVYEDEPNTSAGPNNLVATGLEAYVNYDNSGVNRWGDYTGAAYDWSCRNLFGATEYAGTSDTWRTRVTAQTVGAEVRCPLLDVTDPDGGETLTHGDTLNITWDRANLNPANEIFVWYREGGLDHQIGGPLPTSSTSYLWSIPNLPATDGRIGVGSWDGASYEEFDWSDRTFTLVGCNEDLYEDDNTPGTATTLVSGVTQAHSLCPVGDNDWFVFTLPSGYRGVTLETDGPIGDTRLYLYNSGLYQIGFDDDGGAGLFSLLARGCDSNPLPGGTYYVKVDEFGNNSFLNSYTMSLATSVCSGVIFVDGFDFGTTSAWGSVVP